MSDDTPNLDWDGLFWETRGYLLLDDDAPVPADELQATAEANGWTDAEFRAALRATDDVEFVDGVGSDLQLAGDDPDDDWDEAPARALVRVTRDVGSILGTDGRDYHLHDGDAVTLPEPNADALLEQDAAIELALDAGDSVDTGDSGDDVDSADAPQSVSGSWQDADFGTTRPDEWEPTMAARNLWMAHTPGEKNPKAPWGDRNDPTAPCTEDDHDAEFCDECSCDARYKWSHDDNYAPKTTVDEWVGMDPSLGGHAFILQKRNDPYGDEADPLAVIDGDDVRDPDSGDVHPAFEAVLEHLGLTYADISVSGGGVHAVYRGELPDGVKMSGWDLDDEPFADHDDIPSIEIYDGKRVCITTGNRVAGSADRAQPWDDDLLAHLIAVNDETNSRDRSDVSTDRDDYDLDDYEPTATAATETTDEVRDIFAAIERLDAEHVASQTIVSAWNDSASTSADKRAFFPSWGPDSNGTATYVNRAHGTFVDTGAGDYGTVVEMALISEENWTRGRIADGEDWWRGVDHLRDLGFDIPEYQPSDDADGGRGRDRHPLLDAALQTDDYVDAAPISALPLGQLDALDHADRRRAARKRGLDWPSTDEARDQLFATITEVMRHEDTACVDAPTSLGKTYTCGTTPWSQAQYDAVTGGKLVVHLSATRDARDEAVEAADANGLDYFLLKARDEACPVAAGDHDPHPEDDDGDRVEVTIHGDPASEWLSAQCNGKGIPFSAAHQHLEEHNDQGLDRLPCCIHDEDEGDDDVFADHEDDVGECPAIQQWDDLRARRDSEHSDLDVVFATHEFAHVPSLRMQTNIIIDEQPDFQQDLSKDRVARAVTAYLQHVNDQHETDLPVTNWEEFIALSTADPNDSSAGVARDMMRDAFDIDPDREWYFEHADAHTLAPSLTRAIWTSEDRPNQRRFGKTAHEPPRLDAGVRDDDSWNREWMTVIMTDQHELETVRVSPDFGLARSVVGLDAHPARPKWMVDVHPQIQVKQVLDPEERQLWRRYERGLRVVQVGDAVRPRSGDRALEWTNDRQLRALFEHLVERYGGDHVRTALTTAQVEDRLQAIMHEAGCFDPQTMHYGEERSRNDYADEPVGVVNGCMDPGDDHIVNILAELDLDATPETVENDDGETRRAKGRAFDGPDADVAQEILASVRENHIAQAAGRYARNPDDPDSHATVFVRTSATPAGFADLQVPGVEWAFTDIQRAIVRELRDAATSQSARDLAARVDCSKEHVRQTLARLADLGHVDVFDSAGDHGATLYSDAGTPASGTVDLDADDGPIAKNSLLDSYRWSLAVSDPVVDSQPSVDSQPESADGAETGNWRDPPDS